MSGIGVSQQHSESTQKMEEKDKKDDENDFEGFKMPQQPPPQIVQSKRKSDCNLDQHHPVSDQNSTEILSTSDHGYTHNNKNDNENENLGENERTEQQNKNSKDSVNDQNGKEDKKPPAKSPAEMAQAKAIPIAYQEPSWGGLPTKSYSLEVLKNGTIVDTIDLKDKSYFVIGRLPNCDIMMEHPSLSRYHAVLQFKSKGSPEKPTGFYLYDLDSTHGSFHNKNKCFPKTYYRLRVGHMLKFGMSTRSLILQGPEEDSEEESELTISEIKEMSAERAKQREEERAAALSKLEKGDEDHDDEVKTATGISWGMADDAEDFPDMDQNPFAETAENEKLYVNDPKKVLKKWFDREGYDLEFEVEEKGCAQFICKIHLPVDAPPGFNTVAQATVKGKKKEATVQAALEACRILDRLNLLNPSQQSAAEKKVKRWEEDDFYASDEDEFLDRTGTIQRKRVQRMKMAGKVDDKIETYETLMEKHGRTTEELRQCEKELTEALARKERAEHDSDKLDLDSYLSQLKKGAQVDKQTIQKLKIKISDLLQELDRLAKLINIAKPSSMPDLKSSEVQEKPKMSGIMIGKRSSKGLLGKVKSMTKDNKTPIVLQTKDTRVLEAFLDVDQERDTKPKRSRLDNSDNEEEEIKPIGYEARPEPKAKERIGDTSVNVLNKLLGPRGPQISDHMRAAIEEKLKGVDPSDNENIEMKINEVVKSVDSLPAGMIKDDLKEISGLDVVDAEGENELLLEKRKRGDRGSKRKRKEENKETEEDVEEEYYKVGADSKYDVWLPPAGQTGDGRTSLNDKLGY